MPNLPVQLFPQEPTPTEQLERSYAARYEFEQLKKVYIAHHYAEEARHQEIVQQWQAERAAEAAELAALEGQEQGL